MKQHTFRRRTMQRTGLTFFTFICLGLTDVLAERIINGNQAKPHSHPYMAALFKGFMLNCGGFLIHKEFILTAAHCEAYPMTVRLGAHNLSKDEPSIQEIKVKKEDVFHHPKYNKYNQWNDIMLVKLRPAAKLTKGVNIIKIPKTDQNVKVDTKCSVAGWGKMATRGMTSDVLMEVPVKVENQSECASRKNYHNLNANMICATGDGIKGTCKLSIAHCLPTLTSRDMEAGSFKVNLGVLSVMLRGQLEALPGYNKAREIPPQLHPLLSPLGTLKDYISALQPCMYPDLDCTCGSLPPRMVGDDLLPCWFLMSLDISIRRGIRKCPGQILPTTYSILLLWHPGRGDSGGPLVCDKPSNALGIVSFSIRDSCEDPNRISLYTRVSAYLPWIKTILKSKAD